MGVLPPIPLRDRMVNEEGILVSRQYVQYLNALAQRANTAPGTTISAYVVGDLLVADGVDTLARLPAVAAGRLLRAAGVGVSPAYSTFTVPDTFAVGDIPHASALNTVTALTVGTVGQIVRSTGTVPAYSTATYPNTVTAGDVVIATAANVIGSLAVGGAGTVIRSTGTAPAYSGWTIPNTFARGDLIVATAADTLTALTVGGAGTVPRSNGTDLIYSTFTIPNTFAVSTLVYASSTNVLAALATANSGVLVTSGAGVPSIATDLPTAVTIGSAYIYRVGGTDIALADGGLNASLTASVGGIFYSTATAGAILAGTATAGQIVRSGASAAPTWSTATYPATATANQLLYASATDVFSGLTSGNNGVLITSGAGVPSISSTIPAATQDNITRLGTIVTNLDVNGTSNDIAGTLTLSGSALQPAASTSLVVTLSDGFALDTTVASSGVTSFRTFSYSSVAAGSGSAFEGARYRGTVAAPAVVQSGDLLFKLSGIGYSAAAAATVVATQITLEADGEWDTAGDTTDSPGRIRFWTVPNGSATLTLVAEMTEQQNLMLGVFEARPTAGSKALILGHGTALSGMGADTCGVFGDVDADGLARVYAIAEGDVLTRLNHVNRALGGGAAPIFGTIGGSGPTVAAQNSWMEYVQGGATYWIPVWV